jgi:IS30 family transposase
MARKAPLNHSNAASIEKRLQESDDRSEHGRSETLALSGKGKKAALLETTAAQRAGRLC